MSQTAFAAKAQIAYPTLRMWFSQARPSIRPEKLAALAKGLGKTREELEEKLSLVDEAQPTLVPVPIINKISAGPMIEHTDLGYPGGIADDYVELPLRGVQAFAMWVSGESMSPRYDHGDLVVFRLLDPETTLIVPGRDYAVQLDGQGDGESCFKRLFPDPARPGLVIAESINPKTRPRRFEIHMAHVARLGTPIMQIPGYAAVGRRSQ